MAALLGLGPGLTPAGDDFLGGVLIALHALGRSAQADRLGRLVLDEAPARTSRISRAHLEAAARGLGAESVHRVLRRLLDPGSDGLDAALADAASIGHTSGLDAVAGVALVLCYACENRIALGS